MASQSIASHSHNGAAVHTRLLRANEVRQRVGLSHSTLWRLQRSGGFPVAIRISPGAVAWREADIEAWIAARVAETHGHSE